MGEGKKRREKAERAEAYRVPKRECMHTHVTFSVSN